MSAEPPRCLLLVEDDALVRDTIALMLEEEGFDVTEAGDAREALALVQNGLVVPVVVTDVDLGSGPSGAELADALHRMHPDLRIIFITGRTGSLAGRTLTEREAILSKPFESTALSRLVHKMTSSELGR